MFTDDLVAVCAQLQADNRRPLLARLICAQDSLVSVLLCGGHIDPPVMTFLWTPGPGRWLATTIVRRLYGQILDSGVIVSRRRANPLQAILGLLLFFVLAALSPYMVAFGLGVSADLTRASLTGASHDGDGEPPSPWPVRVAALAVGASLAVLRATYNGPSASATFGSGATFGATFVPPPLRAAQPAAGKPKPKRPARSPARRAA